jgi:hypothetical protein
MFTARRRIVVPVAIILALTLPPTLSGCSVENIVKSATGGKVDIGGNKVPSDFPSSVPLIKGTVVLGAGLGSGAKKLWNVTIKVPAENSYSTIKSELTAAGFTGDFGTSSSEGATGNFTNKTYDVLVVVAGDGKSGWVANYSVSPAPNPSPTPTPTP